MGGSTVHIQASLESAISLSLNSSPRQWRGDLEGDVDQLLRDVEIDDSNDAVGPMQENAIGDAKFVK